MIRLVPANPRTLTVPLPVAAAATAFLVGGPVAAAAAAVYAYLGTRALTNHVARRTETEVRTRSLDDLCSLSADLRAGLTPANPRRALTVGSTPTTAARPAIASRLGVAHRHGTAPATRISRPDASRSDTEIAALTAARVAALTAAVWRLAERTGAPAADLVDRIEADRRAIIRARTAAEAQAAGTRMTAVLLAALPAVGLALGHSIGVNALQVLLTTTPGAVCALAALALQCAGLAWSSRLIAGAAR